MTEVGADLDLEADARARQKSAWRTLPSEGIAHRGTLAELPAVPKALVSESANASVSENAHSRLDELTILGLVTVVLLALWLWRQRRRS